MLKFLRSDKTKKRIYLFLAVIIVITFGISGVVLNQDKQNPASSLGSIHGHRISVQDYLNSYKAIGHQAQLIYGDSYQQIRPYINLKGEAWDRLILLDYAKRQGIKTSDKEVVQWLAKQPFFQSKGVFDSRIYELILQRLLQVDARHFEEEIRQMLTIGKISEKLASRMPVSDAELKKLYAREYGRRSIRYAVFSSDSQTPAAKVTDEELKKIYPLYESRLKEPAKVKIRYVFVPVNPDASLLPALQENQATLEELSGRYGLNIAASGYFFENQSIDGIGLEPEILEKSFSLAPQTVSDWILTGKGSYKIVVDDKKEAHALSYEDALDKLGQILSHQKAVELTVARVKEIAAKAKKDGFDKTMAEEKASVRTFDEFKPGSYIPDIGPADSIGPAVAALKIGEVSGALPVPKGAAIVEVIKDFPVDENMFSAAKEMFRKKISENRSQKGMQDLLETLRKDVLPNLELMKQIFPEEEDSVNPKK